MVRKVAILAPFRGANFGTVLQAFALSRFLCSHGIDGEYINYTSLRKSTFLERVVKKIRRIINKILYIWKVGIYERCFFQEYYNSQKRKKGE